MNRDPLPYPPQMRNGGSPPAHLSSSSLSDPSGWLQYRWSQPPPRAPYWVFDDFQKFNPPTYAGRPPRDEEWLQRALRKDQQAAGLMPPKLSGGPILLGACVRAEHAYQDWKGAVDELWEHKRHRLQTAARQHHIDEQAARKKQEAAHCQRLLDERAANKRQEAARKEAARCQRPSRRGGCSSPHGRMRCSCTTDGGSPHHLPAASSPPPPRPACPPDFAATAMRGRSRTFAIQAGLLLVQGARGGAATTGSCSASDGFGRHG
jgi:hypothetical protein